MATKPKKAAPAPKPKAAPAKTAKAAAKPGVDRTAEALERIAAATERTAAATEQMLALMKAGGAAVAAAPDSKSQRHLVLDTTGLTTAEVDKLKQFQKEFKKRILHLGNATKL
ncbi:hypothetical protein [Pelomonas sp. KK5]|uniref:hypothetical protein n=1 Tax=Pelomonas sp. KK5 TaxID=1855730 RepID=UPI00097C81E8|nr:hypothetical protein [Pelomonas sp. KK5]